MELFPVGNIADMGENDAINQRAAEKALAFGSLIRSRRRALNMRQDELALATGVGRRFVIELEAGKPSCQLGRCLLVADALGLLSSNGSQSATAAGPDLPDLLEEVEEPDGQRTRIL